MKPRIRWVGKVAHADKALGNFVGYAVSNAELVKALEPHVVFDDDSDVVVTYGTPMDHAHPGPEKHSVLFTMYESPDMPYEARIGLATADVIITPSRFCADLFRDQTSAPIYTCPLGVDTELFRFKSRSWRPGQPFRWLYVGAPNPRKFTELEQIYTLLLSKWPGAQLYIKTTGADLEQLPEILSSGRAREVQPGVLVGGNVVFDHRRLSREELVDLYHSANAFLFLHAGEGWGLTACEALATGLPVVLTDYSGVQEFADRSNSFPVKLSGRVDRGYAWPDLEDSMRAVGEVMLDYPLALKRGKQGSRDMRRFTWGAAGRKLASILDRVTQDKDRGNFGMRTSGLSAA